MERTVHSGHKEKKKQSKYELDRLKQAEKKKRRLNKALAASAAIRLELEKKKQKKEEEQQRLDEEGAAIAEAAALHVLLGEEDSKDCSNGIDLFMDYKDFYKREDGYGVGWNPWFQGRESFDCSQALSSLQIADGSKREVLLPRIQNSAADVVGGMLQGSCADREVDFYGGF